MSKAKYSNLNHGVKVLASDSISFSSISKKGYNLLSLMREYKNNNMNRLPKKSELEAINCTGVVRNIEKLWDEMVKYNQSVSTKKERKVSLERIVELEKTICTSLGLTIREPEAGMVEYTETITINQYEFFANCFAYRTKKGKVATAQNVKTITGTVDVAIHDSEHVTMDCTTLSTFKKNVLFGLVEACSNDGTIYGDDVQKKCRENLKKRHDREEKSEKSEREAAAEKVTRLYEDYLAMLSSLELLDGKSEDELKSGFEKYLKTRKTA